MTLLTSLHLLIAGAGLATTAPAAVKPEDRIQPYRQNPFYWQYKGRPVLLLGGTDDHNLFQWEEPRLRPHLDLLASVGGNYLRNTMSSREKGNVQPFARRSDGRYDLDRWNDVYWQRFETLLKLAHERDIIVQIELWDRFDFAREPWEQNAYNPENNVTYTAGQSGLEPRYPQHPGSNQNPFFRTVPGLDTNEVVLRYQRAQVDRMLAISLEYPNVLYCVDNETSGRPEWGAYWADHIRRKAKEKGVAVHTTEMWDPWDLGDPLHRNTFDHPEIYTFVDISQNNHQKGQTHWDNMQQQRRRIAGRPRPMNNVKIYGADTGRYGTDRDGIERFWRNVIGGMASARFHRPASGLGLSEKAQRHIKSARMLSEALKWHACAPRDDLLSDRAENEAYVTAEPGRQYAVYFPEGGSVTLDLSGAKGVWQARWLEIGNSRWAETTSLEAGRPLRLDAPDSGHWAVVLLPGNAR